MLYSFWLVSQVHNLAHVPRIDDFDSEFTKDAQYFY